MLLHHQQETLFKNFQIKILYYQDFGNPGPHVGLVLELTLMRGLSELSVYAFLYIPILDSFLKVLCPQGSSPH